MYMSYWNRVVKLPRMIQDTELIQSMCPTPHCQTRINKCSIKYIISRLPRKTENIFLGISEREPIAKLFQIIFSFTALHINNKSLKASLFPLRPISAVDSVPRESSVARFLIRNLLSQSSTTPEFRWTDKAVHNSRGNLLRWKTWWKLSLFFSLSFSSVLDYALTVTLTKRVYGREEDSRAV